MKINNIRLLLLRNGEHFQFHTDFKELAEKYGVEKLGIKSQYEAYLLLYAHEDEVLEKIRKSAITQQITDADTTRDTTFKGLIEVVSAGQKHFSAAVREATRKVQILIDSYKDIAKLPYNEETAKIYNLVQELQTLYAEEVATMKIEEWVQELDNNNKYFESLFESRYEEQFSKTPTNAREIRTQIDASYKTLTDIVTTFSIVTPKPEYNDFMRELNIRIDYYNNTLSQRQGRAVAKKETGTKDDEVKG
ncbi:MAG: DUF6261 family protein [Anaerovoracaceae bacterium]